METCPSCEFPIDAGAVECPRCGIVLAKFRSRGEADTHPPEVAPGSVEGLGAPDTAPTWAPPPRAGISERTVQSLTAMRPWVNFLGIYLIVCALLVFAAAIALLVLSPADAGMRFLPLVYVVEAIILLAIAFPLKRSGDALKPLPHGDPGPPLEEFVVAHATFWRRSGIVTLVFLILAVLLFTLAITGALATGLFRS